ncbi:MAG: helix-hairpin-helix domain-containing protein [Candidatus Omnitrophota bacterium]|jgi:competence ComEA-like helix-hairpin-helix protein
MLNLTSQEKKVIIFLISVALLGSGADVIIKRNSRARELFSIGDRVTKININSADKEVLMSIPGIGEKLADRIIEYRKLNNGFQDYEQLRGIKGFTRARLEKIKDNLIVR